MKKIKKGDIVEVNGRRVSWVCGCDNAPLNEMQTKNCPWCMESRPTKRAPDVKPRRAVKAKTRKASRG